MDGEAPAFILRRSARTGRRYLALPSAVPKTWFAIVKTFADTAYHREVLAHGGHHRRWAAR
jgi:hypothetical protein